jgi:hypothetical protein
MASGDSTGFLTLRVGGFQRTTRATAEGGRRVVNISDCPVTQWYVISDKDDDKKLAGQSFAKEDQLLVSVVEAKPGEPRWGENPEKIGAAGGDSANLYLPLDAFSSFWDAAEAVDGATRHIELVLKSDGSNVLCVTNVGLIESMPAPPRTPPEKDFSSLPLPRVHPVVAEIRTMREQLGGLSRSLLVWVYVALAAWLAVSLFHWLRP